MFRREFASAVVSVQHPGAVYDIVQGSGILPAALEPAGQYELPEPARGRYWRDLLGNDGSNRPVAGPRSRRGHARGFDPVAHTLLAGRRAHQSGRRPLVEDVSSG